MSDLIIAARSSTELPITSVPDVKNRAFIPGFYSTRTIS